jgi:hypothetical protein
MLRAHHDEGIPAMMTRKDYEVVAEVIATTSLGNVARETFGVAMAEVFAADNPRFDPERFFEAAAISGEGYTA